MKKILKNLCIFVILIFILPSIFTKKRQGTSVNQEENNNANDCTEQNENNINDNAYSNYDYGIYNIIKLYHKDTKTIENISFDEYLYGVVSSEMPVDYEIEALKAQAIVARTYTIYQIQNSNNKHGDADICDDSRCCQAWISKEERIGKWDENRREDNWSKIVDAVDSTSGKIITYNSEPIDAFFHANSGGITETAINVWGGTNYPYLQSVETAGEEGYNQYNSELEISKEEFITKLREKYEDIDINFENENEIKILEKTESGRVKTIKIGNEEFSGTEIRKLLGLKSTNFTVEILENTIKFSVIGYGHGVGMSQTGADSMAKTGATAEDIIHHFYTGVEITSYFELK